MRVTDFQMVLK